MAIGKSFSRRVASGSRNRTVRRWAPVRRAEAGHSQVILPLWVLSLSNMRSPAGAPSREKARMQFFRLTGVKFITVKVQAMASSA